MKMRLAILLICALVWAAQCTAQFDDADDLTIPDSGATPDPIARGSVSPYPVRPSRGKFVDLHAHAFMDRGLGLLFSGDFRQPLVSRHWSDRFSSQINAETLEASGLGLIVVSLYAHPVLVSPIRMAIRQQIADAEEFVRTHPSWVIAKTPREARRAYEQGKRIMILSLEGSSSILENEEDYREFIDDKGIRIVTFAHLADDHLTGAAFIGGIRNIGNPRGLLASLFSSGAGDDGVRLNPNGMTDLGRKVARDLIRRKVWIDLAHSPDSTARELIPMLRRAGQPLLYTHTSMRKYLRAERGISDWELAQVRESGGVLGVVPAQSMVGNAPSQSACEGGIFSLVAQFNEIASIIGDERIFIGSDFNGALDHLPPSKPCFFGTTLDTKGLYNIGQSGEFWLALKSAGANSQQAAEHGVENFISVWEKVFK